MTRKNGESGGGVLRFGFCAGLGVLGAALVCLISVQSSAAVAQAPGGDRIGQRTAANNAAIMIVADHPDTTMMKIADDLSIALRDEAGGLRVVPVVGDGAERNIRDLILLRNMDVAITDLTTLERMKRSKDLSQNLALEVSHLVTLFPDKLQLIARASVKSIKELTGKRVGIGLKESGTAAHAEQIFKAFGIRPVIVNMAPIDSAEAIVGGEIDAFICFCLTSPGIYQRTMFNVDLHLLPIPFEVALHRDYLPATLTHEEFPSFISKGQNIETVAVSLVLVTYNWPKDNPRYTKVATFVQRSFDNIGKLQKPPRHRGWQSVQISASVPGWPRFAAAADWQATQRQEALQDMRVAFNQFLSRWTAEIATIQAPEQTKLFEEFLQWRETAR